MCRRLYYLQSDKGNRCDWWLLILISAFRMTQILRHPAPGVDRTPQVGKTEQSTELQHHKMLCVFLKTRDIMPKMLLSEENASPEAKHLIGAWWWWWCREQRVSAYMSAWESFILKHQRWNWLFCRLDGAKKPWDRANSADRSMVSRWAQPIGYVSVKQKHDSESNGEWFLIFFFGVSCRVRPGGGGSDADSLDLDRMKQVKKVQKTPTTSQSLKQRCVCFLNLPCVLACYNKNNLFFSKADCLLLERVQQWLKKYVMCNEHWWVFWSVSFAFRKSWKRCFVNCTKWRMKSSMVRLICSWNTHEG